MKNTLVFLLVAVASATCATAEKNVVRLRGVMSPPDLSYENVEFPPYDETIWRQQRPGRIAKAAAASARHTPRAPETPALLSEVNRLDDALQSLEELVDRYPEDIGKAFELLTPQFSRFRDEVHPDRLDRLQQIVFRARRQAATLPREDAARAISHVLFAEAMFFSGAQSDKERDRQRSSFIDEYRGTEAALLVEVDMMSRRGDIQTEIANLRKFAADHPRSTAAAKALYQAGFQLGVNVGISGRTPKGTDPTDRILQVVELMNELESGRYPDCEWVQRAPSLVTHFFASQPSYAPHNVDKLLTVYQTLLDRHPNLVNQEDVNFAVGTLTKMAELYTLKGHENGIDAVFANMDRRPGQAGSGAYLKAMLYIRPMNDQRRDERPALIQRVREALIKVQENGNSTYQRRSLAILASLYFAERDFAKARDTHRRYVQKYPHSSWSWVAALRLGQSLDALGEAGSAVDVYREVAVTHSDHAVARTFGRAYAARSLESLNRFDEALVEIERAVHGWDSDFGQSYSLSMGFPGIPRELMMDDLRKEQLEMRVAQLRASLNTAQGRLVERGRWLLDHGRPTEALSPLDEALRSSRDSRTAAEARQLIHRVRLRHALDLATAVPTRDVRAALVELDLIARDEPDAITFAAKVAKASILWMQNASSEAEALMQKALGEWQSHQLSFADPMTPVGHDVAEIRNLLYQFDNEPIYGRWAGSRQGRRRSSVAPFIVVQPDVRVKLFDGSERVISVFGPLAVKERALFLTRSDLSLLQDIHMRLEGEYSGKPSRVQQLWSRFFPVGISMAATLVLGSDPIIQDIEFLDAGRTRAAARVAIGHEGTTVILEKDDAGLWKAVRLTKTWIA